jgi:hypothetical protein
LKKKTFVFVDTENIGALCPNKLPKHHTIYYFISDLNLLKSAVLLLNDKHMIFINMNEADEAAERTALKNEMDLCILAKLACVLHKRAKKKKLENSEFIILSKDKGYDKAIAFLNETYQACIRREEMSLRKFVEEKPDPYEDLPEIQGELPKNKALHRKAKKYRSFDLFKKSLTPSEKKMIRIDYACSKDNQPVWFEYDFYRGQYLLMYSGSCINRFASRKEGQKEYEKLTAPQSAGEQPAAALLSPALKNKPARARRRRHSAAKKNYLQPVKTGGMPNKDLMN